MFYIAILVIILITLIIWVMWQDLRNNHGKEIYEMNESERENNAKHEMQMKEESAREQANLTEQARIENERRATEQRAKEEQERQERLRKETERRRAEQNKKHSIVGPGNDIVTQSARITEQSVKMLYDDTKSIIKSTKEMLQKRAEEKKMTEGECNKIIESYANLKNNVEQLDKLNKSMETLKDKRVMEKYQASKESLEKKICDTLEITKDKPKLFQRKQTIEKSFRERVEKGLADLGAKAEIAKARLSEIRSEKRTGSSRNRSASTGRTANRKKQ